MLVNKAITMTDSKQTVVLNLAPTIDQINADRITQVIICFIKFLNDKAYEHVLFLIFEKLT